MCVCSLFWRALVMKRKMQTSHEALRARDADPSPEGHRKQAAQTF